MENIFLLCIPVLLFLTGLAAVNLYEKSRSSAKPIEKECIKIAFENPFLTDSLSEELEKLSGKYPRLEFFFYSGSAQEIMDGLTGGTLDFGFVDKPFDVPKGLQSIELKLKPVNILIPAINMELQPLSYSERSTEAIFSDECLCVSKKDFMGILSELASLLEKQPPDVV